MAHQASDGNEFTNRPAMLAHEARLKHQAGQKPPRQPRSDEAHQAATHSATITRQNDKRFRVVTSGGHDDVHDSLDEAMPHLRALFEGNDPEESDQPAWGMDDDLGTM